jgi:tripartite-type tricarboxylate transporter receptor subunit TctC
VGATPQVLTAQDFPTRPITMVAPFPAGGAVDAIGRVMTDKMREVLGQPVSVENVTGAAGTIRPTRVARSPADGYTLALGTSGTHVISGATMSLNYDVVADFEPVALLTTQPLLVVARKDMPGQNLKELIAWLKANPDKASQATTGPGSAIHLAGVLFQRATRTSFEFVPYRGTNLAMQDLIAGRVDMLFDLASLSRPHVEAGSIKAYAVMSDRRFDGLPDLPTVDELGLPGVHMSVWLGLWAPKNTPKPIVAKLNAAVVAALADAGVRAKLANLGQSVFPRERQTPEALAAYQKAEIDRWWPMIKEIGVKPK